MSRQLSAMALTACVGALLISGAPTAEAKQHCSTAMPSDTNGKWWSYRLIDGRKCWYQGKPGLSKALLEWPKAASEQASRKDSAQPSRKMVVSIVPEKRFNPLDAQAWAPKEAVQAWAPEEALQARAPNYIPETFDALWTARIWLLDR